MKRRVPAPPVEAEGIPAELLDYRPAEWDDGTPPPDWWGTGSSAGMDWRKFHARRRHMDACRAWRELHEVDLHEWDRLRGACDDACRAAHPYEHWHG